MRISFVMVIMCAALVGLGLTLGAAQARADSCTVDADCDDGLFCNGFEFCNSGTCDTAGPPCPEMCIEQKGMCVHLGRITLCHWNGSNEKTISIGAGAVVAHLKHGDTLGPCF
jgi:hypothetical protein